MATRSREFTAVLLLLLLGAALAQRESRYDAADDDDDDGGEGGGGGGGGGKSGAAPVDYSQYFGGAGGARGAAGGGDGGFVSPIDFAALLAHARQGEAGEAVAASSSRVQDFFRAVQSGDADGLGAPGFSLPLESGVFGGEQAGAESQNNGTGFTSPTVRFPSLFDASSGSEAGFRPQDFLPAASAQRTASADPSSPTFYSPSFSKLETDYRPQASYSQPRPASPSPSSYPPPSSYSPQSSAPPSSYSPQSSPPPSSYPRSSPYSNPSSYSTPSSSAPQSTYPQTKPVAQVPSHDIDALVKHYLPDSAQNPTKLPHLPQQYQPSSGPRIALDVYGSKVYPNPSVGEPHVGKSSYPTSQPLDYTGKNPPKPLHDATRVNPEYYSGPTLSPYSAAPSSKPPPVNYSPQASNGAPSQQSQGGSSGKGKNCKKIDKTITTEDLVHGRFRRNTPMSCYVCEDPKTGGNYEECSYATEPKSSKYFVGHAQSYSSDTQPKKTSYRYKRSLSGPFGFTSRSYDPYFSADSSYQYPYSSQSSYNPDDYRFGPEAFKAAESADYSAAPSDKNCQKVQKDSMTCYHCKDPKTGGSYEQCSYSQTPKENNYFVARQSSFNTANQPDGESSYHDRYRRDEKYGLGDPSDENKQSSEDRPAGIGLDPFLYGQPNSYDSNEKDGSSSDHLSKFYAPYRSYEEYFRHLFPELDNREPSASSPQGVTGPDAGPPGPATDGFQFQPSIPEYFTDTEKKKDLDAALSEFTQKDRTDCKRVQKDKMTCYQCIDKKGMQHEECMFVAASEPKSQHLAYHEVKEFSLVPKLNPDKNAAASSKVSAAATAPAAGGAPDDVRQAARAALAATAAALGGAGGGGAALPVAIALRGGGASASSQHAAAADGDEMVAAASELRPAASEDRPQQPKQGRKAQPEPEPPELSEMDRSPDGLYSAETRHRFDPVLKVTLPEYMLTRSEHEDVFDEVMASGR